MVATWTPAARVSTTLLRAVGGLLHLLPSADCMEQPVESVGLAADCMGARWLTADGIRPYLHGLLALLVDVPEISKAEPGALAHEGVKGVDNFTLDDHLYMPTANQAISKDHALLQVSSCASLFSQRLLGHLTVAACLTARVCATVCVCYTCVCACVLASNSPTLHSASGPHSSCTGA